MTRLFYTGFETGDHENNGGRYTSPGASVTVQSDVKRTGTYALKCQSGTFATEGYAVQVVGDVAEIYFRLALQHNYPGSGNPLYTKFLSFHEGGSEHISVAMSQEDLMLRLYVRGSVVDIGGIVISPNTWYVIEGRALIANSGGNVVVKVNSSTDLSYTGDTCATANEYVSTCRFGGQTMLMGGAALYLDDIAMNDTDGTYQNSWVGLGGVYFLKPTADGAHTGWTPSEGSDHYDDVDETPPNTTDWVQGVSPGTIDTYAIEDCPPYIDVINLVQVLHRAAVIESGSNTIEDVVRQGGVDYNGVSHVVVPLIPSYNLYKGEIYYVQPDGSGAWSVADVDALEVGMEIVA